MDSHDHTTSPPIQTSPGRFGAGLTELEVRRFLAILSKECGRNAPLTEAWSRAIELLSLVEMLLLHRGVLDQQRDAPKEFALPRS
jgi:hypothetical protein